MLSEKMEAALNNQINAEAFSGYLYIAMSAYFQDMGLKGFASWMGQQAREEMFHATKIYNYVNERGGRVKLQAIEAPQTEWKSPLAAFEEALNHERKVTGLINNLVDMAKAESDHASDIFLQWFVTEQVEEEDSVGEVVQQLRLIGEAGHGLFMLDKEMSQRAISPATAAVLTGSGPIPE